MKASLKWLGEYVKIKMRPEDLAETLTMAGVHVASLEKIGDDYVFEFEITSNRNDCLSMIGIAREIAAITGNKLKIPKDLSSALKKGKKKTSRGNIKIEVKNKNLCPRYTDRVIRNLKVGPSPEWLKERLKAIGLRPVNNVVDITNFLLIETGQPMHAFDLDKINGKVIIRKAEKSETIKTIDGSTRMLEKDMLLITDSKTPIAIAGVMGGLDAEVSSATKNILLESAWFDSISVRRTARKLGISTESSYRFERKIDKSMVLPASIRAAHMIQELAGGEIGELIDTGTKKDVLKTIKVDPEKVNKVLGIKIPLKRQKDILQSLGCLIKKKGKSLEVKIPIRRQDISQEVDVTEEIARIYGYNRIPDTIPAIIGNTSLMDKESIVKRESRKILSSMGLNEIMTYNLVPENLLDAFQIEKDDVARVQNPLSQEQEVLTQTLLLGMLKAIAWNINRKNKNLSLYEIGKTYIHREKSAYDEELKLSIALTGIFSDNWLSGRRKVTFFDLKGILETFLGKLGIYNVDFRPKSDTPDFSAAAQIECSGKLIGVLGKLDKRVLDHFDIQEEVYAAEISLAKIIEIAKIDKQFKPIPRFPSVVRDISLLLENDVIADNIVQCVRSADSGLVKKISLVDIYKGKQIPPGKKGLLYRIEYRDDSKTLTDKEVEELHSKIKNSLVSKLGASFR